MVVHYPGVNKTLGSVFNSAKLNDWELLRWPNLQGSGWAVMRARVPSPALT